MSSISPNGNEMHPPTAVHGDEMTENAAEAPLADKDSLVLEDGAADGTQAVLDGADPTEEEQSRRDKRRKMAILFLLLVLAVVIPSVLLTRDKNKSQGVDVNAEDKSVGSLESQLTDSPSASPTSSLELSAAYQILAPLVEPPSLLLDADTPQGSAFLKIHGEGSTDSFDIIQRFALFAIYFSTGGPSWVWNTGWGTSDEVCSWFGVAACRRKTDGKLAVARLELMENNLKGTWPAEACLLTDLEGITIQQNMLGGPLPACMASLTRLEELNVNTNQFSGPLPSGLMALPDLKIVIFSDNQFGGRIDTLFYRVRSDVAPPNLTELKLDNNQLDGEVPTTISKLTNLSTLTLHGNMLSGGDAGMCPRSWGVLTADCMEVDCTCCTDCF